MMVLDEFILKILLYLPKIKERDSLYPCQTHVLS